MKGPWIELKDLQLSRGGRPVLRGLNATISGHAVGLVGANGAGKSTLIGALLGVLRAQSGSIEVLGLPIPQQAMALRTRAGVMAEQAGIFPGGSGVDAVAFAGALNGLSRREALRRAHRALDALGVGEERYRPTKGYSTGMRQLCKLAMSLVHEPEVLILDEPSVGLDPPARAQLLELIYSLTDKMKVLFSTHIMQDAEQICDQLLLLDGGKMTYSGTTRDLLGAQDERLFARGVGIDADFASTLGAAGLSVSYDGKGVHFDGDDESLAKFWSVAAHRQAEVRHLGPVLRSLEDAVVEAMSGTEKEAEDAPST